jgi:hypothetical protein
MKEHGVSRWKIQSVLTDGVANGTIEVKKFLLPSACGDPRAVPHYRLAK